MPSSDQREVVFTASRAPFERRGPRPQASYCYLLDADNDLAQEFDLRMRVVVAPGGDASWCSSAGRRVRPDALVRARPRGPGLLLLDGVIAVDVRVGDRTATELRRRRRPAAAARPTATTTCSSTSTRVAGPAPDTLRGARRGVRRARRAVAADCPSAAAPRGQARVRPRRAARDRVPAAPRGAPGAAALAPRRALGARRAGGIRLSLPLTHRLLGQLVGAERPSVSHALARLARRRARHRRAPTNWHLHGTLESTSRASSSARRAVANGAAPPPSRTREPDAQPEFAPGQQRTSGSRSTSSG